MALTKIKADGLTADLIDETKLADNSIDSEHYNDGSIDEAHIADDAVTADKLANAINTDIAAKAVLTGSTNNTIPTVTGANAISGEANLTFDGSKLVIAGTGSTDGNNTVDGAGFNSGTLYHRTRGASAGIAGTDYSNQIISKNGSNVALEIFTAESNTGTPVVFGTNGVQRARVETNGNFTISDGDLVIGTAGHGIDFSANSNGPGTSVSELFHTYEEGYWIPTFGNNFTVESSYQNFQYTRVGRLVTVRGYVYPSSWSGSDSIYLTLPFASLNDADSANSGAGGCMFRYLDGCTGGLASYVGDNASAMYFYRCESGNSNYSALTTGNLQTGALWYVSHTYAAA